MRVIDLNTHDEGCTPVKPCKNCEVRDFLKANLHDTNFARFIALLEKPTDVEELERQRQEKLDLSVNTLSGMSNRARRVLKQDSINTIRQLLEKSEAELRRIPDIGDSTIFSIKESLRYEGFTMGELVATKGSA